MSAAPQPQTTRDDGEDPRLAGVRTQSLFRDMNEEINRVAERFPAVDELDLICECERGDCFVRLLILPSEYEAVRRFPTRFVAKPGHVAADDRIVDVTVHYIVVEKIGPGAEAAILLDPRRALRTPPA